MVTPAPGSTATRATLVGVHAEGKRRGRQWLVPRTLLLLMVIGVVASATPAYAQNEPVSQPRGAVSTDGSAAELSSRADADAFELDQITTDLHDIDATVADLHDRIQQGGDDYDVARQAQDRAFGRLSLFSVSAYISGGVVQSTLTDSLLRGGGGDIDLEGQRVLTVTAHRELVAAARASATEVDGVSGALDQAETDLAAATERQRVLDDQRAQLINDIATLRDAAARAAVQEVDDQRRADDAAEAERNRAREDELRAATPRPEAFRSGVIPSSAVRAEIIAALGGEIPSTALNAYYRGAQLANRVRPGCNIDWALIAAIGRVETNHGRYGGSVVAPDGSTSPTILGIPLDGRNGTARVRDTDGGALDGDPSVDRAVGPMQFIPGTWRAFAADGNGDGTADPHNIYDAAAAAGNYLCATGSGPLSILDNASRAVYAYNRSTPYNVEVITLADHYRRTVDPTLPPLVTPTVPANPTDLPDPASPDTTAPDDPGPTSTTVTTVEPTTTSSP